MASQPGFNPPPPPRWVVDLNTPLPRPTKATANIPDPPGFSRARVIHNHSHQDSVHQRQEEQQEANKVPQPSQKPSKQTQGQPNEAPTKPQSPAETDALKLKKAWEIALAPSKQLPMNAIMMYFSGNGLQIFSIMMVFMLFKGPIQGLLGTNSVFAKFETEGTRGRLWGVKAVYVLMQFGLLALGIWKVNGMGLLPTTRSDWLAWEAEREPLERAYFAFS